MLKNNGNGQNYARETEAVGARHRRYERRGGAGLLQVAGQQVPARAPRHGDERRRRVLRVDVVDGGLEVTAVAEVEAPE